MHKFVIHSLCLSPTVGAETVNEREEELNSLVEVLVRNLYAFYPLLIKFVDRHRSAWLKHPTQETQRLFTAVARMFLVWTRASVSSVFQTVVRSL